MMKKVIIQSLLIFSVWISPTPAQVDYLDEDGIEVFLIDAYVTSEPPSLFVISFFTSDSCKSEVVLDSKYTFEVSKEFTDDHQKRIEITNLKYDSLTVPFMIIVTDKNGVESKSQNFELILPMKNGLVNPDSPGLFTICCFGGIIFGLPSPTIIYSEGESFFALSKEIPVISFYSSGYNYPAGYLGIEYQYIFNSAAESFIRLGYKHIFQIPKLEYISPGLSYVTNTKGFNGVSPELSVGLFRIYNVFTLYTKYRYNIKLGERSKDFHEISVGLYSNFFSFNL